MTDHVSFHTDLHSQVYLAIYIGPGAADGADDEENNCNKRRKLTKRTRANVATLAGLDEVTPRTIAYAAVLVSFLPFAASPSDH